MTERKPHPRPPSTRWQHTYAEYGSILPDLRPDVGRKPDRLFRALKKWGQSHRDRPHLTGWKDLTGLAFR